MTARTILLCLTIALGGCAARSVSSLHAEKGPPPDRTPSAPDDGNATERSEHSVTFGSEKITQKEGAGPATVKIALPHAADAPVEVSLVASGGNAYAHSFGTGQDFSLPAEAIVFAPGETEKIVAVEIRDDLLAESDEKAVLELRTSNKSLDSPTLTIEDDDRKNLVDVVADFGAKGDGSTDDTAPIKKAVDQVWSAGGDVIHFPPRTYIVRSIELRENITYEGYGATLKRPESPQGKWMRTFTAHQYRGATDSPPLVIKGLESDGCLAFQGEYSHYELEQAHLVFLSADPSLCGRLTAFVEDVRCREGVADCISVFTNVNASMFNIESRNVFRGGFVLTGGHSMVKLNRLRTFNQLSRAGIDIEVDGEGYGGTLKVEVEMDDLVLENGAYDIAVFDGSRIVASHVDAGAPLDPASRKETECTALWSLQTTPPTGTSLNSLTRPLRQGSSATCGNESDAHSEMACGQGARRQIRHTLSTNGRAAWF